MIIKADSIVDYFNQLPPDRKTIMEQLHQTILNSIPKGFESQLSYGMIGYVVPQSIYPQGYHCNPKLPLPFVNIASQKNGISIYHMGIYAHPPLLNWFTQAYAKAVKTKLDMGKSCIRFKKPEEIPLKLIGELMGKMTVKEWVKIYESNFLKK